MNASTLDIAESRSGAVCIVTLNGRIDSSNASAVSGLLNRLMEAGEKSILVDLGAVLYLTSAAFRALLIATNQAERQAARLVLCCVVGQVRELFEMGGLLEVFTIHASREDALARLA